MKASQTGLKMFSTIHAGDCVRTINRLMDLNVSTMSLLAGSVSSSASASSAPSVQNARRNIT